MNRKYINTISGESLIVNINDIVEKVVIADMLVLPKHMSSIYDIRIEYIEDEIETDIKNIQEYIFILDSDLDEDVKTFYRDFNGSLWEYCEANNIKNVDEFASNLHEKLLYCLCEKRITPSCLVPRRYYKGMLIYDPDVSIGDSEWLLTA